MSIPASDAGYAAPLGYLEVHLDRVRANYLSLLKYLGQGVGCAAVVKADAYGIGAAEVAAELHKAGCRDFYVAHASEGVAVRQALGGGHAQIYALHGPYGMKPAEFLRYGLVPVLNSLGDIAYWTAAAAAAGAPLPAVLQFDTGMNRLGLTAEEVDRLKGDPAVLKGLEVRYLLSHLACADEAEHPKNREQLEKFRGFAAGIGLSCPLSFANSAGIFLGPEYHFDQVRPGAALYGINAVSGAPNPMQDVVSFRVRILQTKDVDRGETVGYGASYLVPEPSKLAILSVGYADGYMRSIAGDGAVYIDGHRCPVVGRVSMDLIAADVTGAARAPQAGDWAEVIGGHQKLDDVAAATRLIGYEILTNLGRRYKRIYTGQG